VDARFKANDYWPSFSTWTQFYQTRPLSLGRSVLQLFILLLTRFLVCSLSPCCCAFFKELPPQFVASLVGCSSDLSLRFGDQMKASCHFPLLCEFLHLRGSSSIFVNLRVLLVPSLPVLDWHLRPCPPFFPWSLEPDYTLEVAFSCYLYSGADQYPVGYCALRIGLVDFPFVSAVLYRAPFRTPGSFGTHPFVKGILTVRGLFGLVFFSLPTTGSHALA